MSTHTEATIADLHQTIGKSEIVNGEIVLMSPSGDLPESASAEISSVLRDYASQMSASVLIGPTKPATQSISSRENGLRGAVTSGHVDAG